VLAIGFIAFSVHFHSRGQETADIAADLGVSGILMIVLAFVISRETQTSSELVRVPPPGRLILVGFVLMGAAVVGAGMARWPRTSPPPPPPPGDGTAPPASPPPTDGAAPGASAPVPSWARTATFIGLGLAALTALLAVLQLLGVLAFDHVNVCEEDVPWWRQAVMFLASCAAVGSLACAAVVLLARRWFVSLVCIVVAPFAWFTAVMTNACIL